MLHVVVAVPWDKPAGLVCSSVLGMKGKDILFRVAFAMGQFQEACPEDDAVSLEPCCNLQTDLEKLTAARNADASAEDRWMQALCPARDRFANMLVEQAGKWIMQKLQEKGHAGAWAYLNVKNLPQTLKVYSSAISQASFLETLKPQEETKEFAELTKRTKSFVTVKSLCPDTLKMLFPEQSDKIQEFVGCVEANVKKVFGKIQAKTKLMSERLQTYRTADMFCISFQLCRRTLHCQAHCGGSRSLEAGRRHVDD